MSWFPISSSKPIWHYFYIEMSFLSQEGALLKIFCFENNLVAKILFGKNYLSRFTMPSALAHEKNVASFRMCLWNHIATEGKGKRCLHLLGGDEDVFSANLFQWWKLHILAFFFVDMLETIFRPLMWDLKSRGISP